MTPRLTQPGWPQCLFSQPTSSLLGATQGPLGIATPHLFPPLCCTPQSPPAPSSYTVLASLAASEEAFFQVLAYLPSRDSHWP